MIRQIASFVLPFTVDVVVPFLLLFDFRLGQLRLFLPHPVLQGIAGGLLIVAGVSLLAATISRFMRQGEGTLAPWDPPRQLVVEGPYAHTRNPMIGGASFVLLGEATLFGSLAVLVWFAFVVLVNTAYFKLSEEPGLVRRFGEDYLAYRRHVPMWLPRITPWRKDGTARGSGGGGRRP